MDSLSLRHGKPCHLSAAASVGASKLRLEVAPGNPHPRQREARFMVILSGAKNLSGGRRQTIDLQPRMTDFSKVVKYLASLA